MTPSGSSVPPPPRFPLSEVNPGPQTKDDWDKFVRWLLNLYRTFVTTSSSTTVNLAMPAPAAFPIHQPDPRYMTFGFDTVAANAVTPSLRIPFPAERTPAALDISAVAPPVAKPGIYDLQTSVDQITWTSILTAPAQLPTGAYHAATVLLFQPGVKLVPGQWMRAFVEPTSDLTALQIVLQLTLN